MPRRSRLTLAALAGLLLAGHVEASLVRSSTPAREAPALSLTLVAPEPSEFSLFEGSELTAAAAESERAPSFHPLAAVSLFSKNGAEGPLVSAAEESYPKTRYRVFELLGTPILGELRGVSLELHWRSASFSAGLASGTVGWLSQDPAGDVDSPNLYGFVGARPHGKTDPLGLAGTNPNPTATEWALQPDEFGAGLRPSAVPSGGEASIGSAFRRHAGEVGTVVGGMAVTAVTEAVIYYTEAKAFEIGVRVVLRGATYVFRTLQEATTFAKAEGATVRYVKQAATNDVPMLSARGTQFEAAAGSRTGARVRASFGEGPEADAIRITDARGAGVMRYPRHHVFPQEHRAFFEARGFTGEKSIDNFTVELPGASHEALHGGGNFRLGRTWTDEWNRRIMTAVTELEKEAGRRLRFEEILSVGEDMMRRYGIDAPFVPFR